MKPYHNDLVGVPNPDVEKENGKAPLLSCVVLGVSFLALAVIGPILGFALAKQTVVVRLEEALEEAKAESEKLQKRHEALAETNNKIRSEAENIEKALQMEKERRIGAEVELQAIKKENRANVQRSLEELIQNRTLAAKEDRLVFSKFEWGVGDITASFRARWENEKLYYVMTVGPDIKTARAKILVNLVHSPYFKVDLLDGKEFAVRSSDGLKNGET